MGSENCSPVAADAVALVYPQGIHHLLQAHLDANGDAGPAEAGLRHVRTNLGAVLPRVWHRGFRLADHPLYGAVLLHAARVHPRLGRVRVPATAETHRPQLRSQPQVEQVGKEGGASLRSVYKKKLPDF